MNIHFTHQDPAICARNLDNSRVVKMITENAQMLSTAYWILKYPGIIKLKGEKLQEFMDLIFREYGIPHLMRPVNYNHPCNIWVRSSRDNAMWLIEYSHQLYLEYCKRYGNKTHKSYELINQFESACLYEVIPEGMISVINCAAHKGLNIDFRTEEDTFQAYRKYLSVRWDLDSRTPKWGKSDRRPF